MKKMIPIHIFLLGILGILLIYSCKKEIGGLFKDDSKPEGLQWAKDYYTQNLQKQNSFPVKLSSSKGTLDGIDIKDNKKTPLWAKATEGRTDLYTFAEIPLKYALKITPTFSISKNPDERPIANTEILMQVLID